MRLEFAVITTACALASAGTWPAPAGAESAGALGRPIGRPGTAPTAAPEKPPHDATPPATAAKWRETHAGLEEADTRECLDCHGDQMATHSHPVGVDYAEAARRAPGGFRPIEEVRARGLILRSGKVGCLSCHSPASRWAHFLAVPPELAEPRPTRDELRADVPKNVAKARALATPLKDGAEVSTRPLCEACHLKS